MEWLFMEALVVILGVCVLVLYGFAMGLMKGTKSMVVPSVIMEDNHHHYRHRSREANKSKGGTIVFALLLLIIFIILANK